MSKITTQQFFTLVGNLGGRARQGSTISPHESQEWVNSPVSTFPGTLNVDAMRKHNNVNGETKQSDIQQGLDDWNRKTSGFQPVLQNVLLIVSSTFSCSLVFRSTLAWLLWRIFAVAVGTAFLLIRTLVLSVFVLLQSLLRCFVKEVIEGKILSCLIPQLLLFFFVLLNLQQQEKFVKCRGSYE